MRQLRFRQPIWTRGIFTGWHYWGFITDGNFSGPNTGSVTIAQAQKESQQFTGLLDKQGKEIYEGDIVKHTSGEPEVNSVEYYCGEWHLEPHGLHLPDENGQVEVIGNIYENKELLEK